MTVCSQHHHVKEAQAKLADKYEGGLFFVLESSIDAADANANSHSNIIFQTSAGHIKFSTLSTDFSFLHGGNLNI